MLKTAAIVLALAPLLLSASARADVLKDPQWRSWLEADQSTELLQAAQARLAIQPNDPQAAIAQGLAAVNIGRPQGIEAALPPLQRCVEHPPQPQSQNASQLEWARCYYVLGVVQGVQAMTGGMLKAMSLTGKVRDNLSHAVELDPALFEARASLVDFYLLAPTLLGGSVASAQEVAAAVAPRQPEQAKLLRAKIAFNEERWDDAERELQSIKSGDDVPLTDFTSQVWALLGVQFITSKQDDKARAVFEGLQRDYPAYAAGAYGLGRVLADLGHNDEAVKQYQRARTLKQADRFPIDYRLGLACLALGDKAQAKAALERFVAGRRSNPRYVDDARDRLAELRQ